MQWRVVRLLAISILPAASLVFYTLVLTGSVADSPGLSNIFLVSLNSSQEAELRVGYFGMCLRHNVTQKCAATPYRSSAEGILPLLAAEFDLHEKRPLLSLSILSSALELQQNVLFCLEAFAGAIFFVGVIFLLVKMYFHMSKGVNPKWRFVEQKWPERVLLASIVLSVVNIAAVTQTANALEFATTKLSQGPVTAKAGITLQVLGWLAFASSAMFYTALTASFGQTRGPASGQDDFGGKFDEYSMRGPMPGPMPGPGSPVQMGPGPRISRRGFFDP